MSKKLIVFIVIIIFLLIVSGLTFCKYINEETFNSDSKIAKPILNLSTNTYIELNDVNPSMNIQNLEFSVKNYENEDITDVSMLYSIIIDDSNSNFEYKLYDNNNNEIGLKNKRTNYIEIGHDKKIEHKYKLKVKCLQNNKKEYSNIKIKINSYQKR